MRRDAINRVWKLSRVQAATFLKAKNQPRDPHPYVTGTSFVVAVLGRYPSPRRVVTDGVILIQSTFMTAIVIQHIPRHVALLHDRCGLALLNWNQCDPGRIAMIAETLQ